ncbi:hypothetical protein E1292_15805 [Nonomuraea deserti]|uniref:Uncharacterized protein n=1 Tax=Nonomuraea deserti TaxID=1848322 RepID=A0A4R4VK71_9ACTN|nr:hypothetical protein [Nonomuraea deserti]TDD06139.1 hypothetical protein E1292_15805 [Nonomuraea deserti]
MSLLEQRYRSVLRLLPASYRAEREEEMVDAFMELSGEAPDEVNPRPRWGEIASVLSLSLRVRLGGAGASPRFVAWGEAVRLVALLGLGYQAVGSVNQLLQWGHALAFGTHVAWTGPPGSVERLVSIVSAADLCSAVAFVAIMRGHVRTAKVMAAIGVAPTLVYMLIPMILAGPLTDRPLSESATLVFTAAPVIALLLGFHSDITPRRRSWAASLWPAAAGLAVLGGTWLVVALRPYDLDWLHLWLGFGTTILVWAAGAVVVLARRSSPPWALAMTATGLLLLAVRLPLLDNLPEGASWTMVCAQCAVLWALSTALAWMGARGLPGASGTSALTSEVGERSG